LHGGDSDDLSDESDTIDALAVHETALDLIRGDVRNAL
jgi:hypothetical protein